jgi:hypothetical protein
MNNILEPLLAIRVPGHELFVLAIVVPIGLAYLILFLQASKPTCGGRKVSAFTRGDLLPEGTELSRAERKQAARLMK